MQLQAGIGDPDADRDSPLIAGAPAALKELLDQLLNRQEALQPFRLLGRDSVQRLLRQHGLELGLDSASRQPLTPHGNASRWQELAGHLPSQLPYPIAPPEFLAAQRWSLRLPPIEADRLVACAALIEGYASGYLQHGGATEVAISVAHEPLADGLRLEFSVHSRTERQPSLPPTGILANASRPALLPRDGELGQLLEQVAPTDASVLLLGESGVGKSLLAREIHALSRRSRQPWVEINCAAIPDLLLESELFGVERGAFSGAHVARKGKFEQAHGGTIFLDEIGLLSLSAQSKLLRVLQSGELERLGSNHTVKCDIRILAATNESLEKLVADGRFREDLYFRLHVFPLHIPPLRERLSEIPRLVPQMLQKFSQKYRKNIYSCTPAARQFLLQHRWPGNIRELENMLERAVIVCPNESEIDLRHLTSWNRPNAMPHPAPAQPPGCAPETQTAPALDELAQQIISHGLANLEHVKTALFKAALTHSHGNISTAAACLGLSRGQFSYQMKKISEMEGSPSLTYE